MLIFSEFDIRFQLPFATPVVAVLHLHPSLGERRRSGDALVIEHTADEASAASRIPCSEYLDAFGNRCARFVAPAGALRLTGNNTVEADEQPDPTYPYAVQCPIEQLPADTLRFLLPSRYCEVDRFGAIAQDLFGTTRPGWERVTAIRDWVHSRVTFNYNAARPTKTAMDVFTERIGVCRDFQHLAITLTRCLNVPARYVTGYIGDIRRPSAGPGDFSAWYQVWMDGRWIDLDARHNYPRLGRILMATGRDAADVAITTSFGTALLTHFFVESNEVDAAGRRVAAAPVDPATAESSRPTQSNQASSPTQTQSATS